MEKKNKDPFISILKDNLKSSDIYKNLNTNNNTIKKNINILLNEQELGKKIGKMETILNYYEVKLNNEFNERKLLEKKYDEKLESLMVDINNIKENSENLLKIFGENFDKIKSNILENIDNKINSINKIIMESVRRISTLEDIIINNNSNYNNNNYNNSSKSMNNSIFYSTEKDSSFLKQNFININNGKYEILLKKVNQLESIIDKKRIYPGREEEINIGITKINHMEKQFELFLEKYNKDLNIIKNTLKQNKNKIENLNTIYKTLHEKYDILYKDFNDTNINLNKFNYQTTIFLNEIQKKVEEYSELFNNKKTELNKLENDLNEEYSLLKKVISEKIDEFDKNIQDFKIKINNENKEFKNNIYNSQEKFINYIQSENNNHLYNSKKIETSIEEQCNIIKKENIELNKEITDIKESFFP